MEVLLYEVDGRMPGVACGGAVLRDWRRCCFAIHGRVLWGMQFWVLVEVLFCESDGRVLRGMQLVELFCESDGRVLGGMQF